MMDEIRIDFPIDAPGFQRGRQKANRVHVAAPPMDGMKEKSLAQYLVGAIIDMRRNMHFIPGRLCRACHGQPV